MEIEIRVLEFDTARAAIRHAKAAGAGVAIRMGGKHLVVSKADADWLAELGACFAYLSDHHGRIVTVPVND